MEDWQKKLSAAREKLKQRGDRAETPIEYATNGTTGEKTEILELNNRERKILDSIYEIETLEFSLAKLHDSPLVAGSSRAMTNYKKAIATSSANLKNLIAIARPNSVATSQDNEFITLVSHLRSTLEKNKDRFEKEKIRIEKIKEATRKTARLLEIKKEMALSKKIENKEKQTKTALLKFSKATIKQYKITKCDECNEGRKIEICYTCGGTGQSAAHNKTITESMVCRNLRPNCPFCAGTGMFFKELTVTSIRCATCIRGKVLSICPTCNGTTLKAKNDTERYRFFQLINQDERLQNIIKFLL